MSEVFKKILFQKTKQVTFKQDKKQILLQKNVLPSSHQKTFSAQLAESMGKWQNVKYLSKFEK